jgi:hypothetical protein
LGQEYIVELIPGQRYRYRYDDGKIQFLGPVGASRPITEEMFLDLLSGRDGAQAIGPPRQSSPIVIGEEEYRYNYESGKTDYASTPPEPEPPCDCGVPYLKQGIIWWCEGCKNNFVME